MLRRLAIAAFAALLSTTAVTAGEPQAKPRPATPRKPVAKPAPPAPAPVVAPVPEPPPPPPGVRMTTAYTQGPQISRNTTYLQGARQRVEFPGIVTLDQCDLKRSVMINTAAKRYRVQPYPEASAPVAAAEPVDPQAAQMAQMAQMMSGAPKPPTRGGVVSLTTSHNDTLERQTMFGLEARRIKTLVIKQSSNTACDKVPLKVEIDAWYVDLPAQAGCTRPAAPAPAASADPNACVDRFETRVAGAQVGGGIGVFRQSD